MDSDSTSNILVIDDDSDVLYTAKLVLRGLFDKVDTLEDPEMIPKMLRPGKYKAILLDMNFRRGSTSGREGLEWLDIILHIDPDVCVLTTTAYGEINLAVTAMKGGASDFIIKPWNKAQLIDSVQNALSKTIGKKREKESGHLRNFDSSRTKTRRPEIISRSPVMTQVIETIRTVAPTDANVLITGETGTGKELAAWALHKASLRKQNVFVHVDLGALPDTLFEAELFGHTRGAFTDAKEDRAGRFEMASGGTLFLDEIGNLSLPLQAKILTTIQNREIIRIGSNRPVPIDVRLISATNMPLYDLVDSFQFRNDLLYRINTVEIQLPPLRKRKEDIELLSVFYLDLFSEQYGKHGVRIRKDGMRKLMEYDWPGNIRELAHVFERAVVLCKSDLLTPEDFDLRIKSARSVETVAPAIRVEDYEKTAISMALTKHNGNLSKAAEELGIARSTLYRKIAHFGSDLHTKDFL